jgi:RNA polymerase sigma factor (TIGR02999 family)
MSVTFLMVFYPEELYDLLLLVRKFQEADKSRPARGEMTGANSIQRIAPLNIDKTSGKTDAEALAEMMPEVYEDLRRLAASYLRGERSEHTLQRTALVHEAYLRLAGQRQEAAWQNRAHFLGIFARIMRQTLTNYAIARRRKKRGGTDPVERALEFYDQRKIDVTVLDAALRDLERLDPRQGQIVELRFFGGLTVAEIGGAMGISPATVKREWATAKIWLRRELSRNS